MCKHCKQVTTRICRKSEFHGETAVKAVDLMIPGGAGPGQRAGNRQIFHRVFVLSPGAAQPALCAEGSDFFLELVEAGGMGCEMTSLPWKLWDYLGSQDVFESESTVQWDCSCFTAGLGSEFTENWEVGYETHILIGVKLLALKAPNDFLSLAHDRAESTNLPAFCKRLASNATETKLLMFGLMCRQSPPTLVTTLLSRGSTKRLRSCETGTPGNVSRHVTTEKKCVWGQKLGLPQVDPICTNQNPHGSWKLHEASQMSHVDTQNLAEQVIEHHQSIIRLIEMDESTPNTIRLVGGLKLGGIWMKLSATRVM